MHWIFITIISVAALIVVIMMSKWRVNRKIRQYSLIRPNLSEAQFVALFPEQEINARAAYSFVSTYLPKDVSPHPDDKLGKDLCLDEDVILQWALEQMGLKDEALFINYDLTGWKRPQTVAELVMAITL